MPDDPGGDARERAEQRTTLVPRREQGSQLPRGHVLQEFVVEQVLGVGSNSIVYLARDTKLDRRVAVKEYLPGTVATRAPDGEVVPRLPRFEPAYKKGLDSFINEARLLGSFDHPSLVKVYRFWAANGTAYMAMPYYEGMTLKKWLADLGAPPSEKWLRQLVQPLMQALKVLHAHDCVHRDIAPDNILLLYERKEGAYLEQPPRPVLLDFGSARRVLADATHNPTSLLKSGFSPVEQYDSDSPLRQGPWTDVYALCAVLYTAAMGRVPNAAIARLVRDDLPSARVAGKGRYTPAFLAAIDAGLTVLPEQRPQSMAALEHWFNRPDAPAKPDPTVPLPPASNAAPLDVPGSPAAPGRPATRWWYVALVTAVGVLALILFGR